MSKAIQTDSSSLKMIEAFTWVVRREMNWPFGNGYSIYLKEVDGCLSYGDTYQEAKKGLVEAFCQWLEKNVDLPQQRLNPIHIVEVEPAMSKTEFDEINLAIQQWR
ncbi:type II toxin-antitoxin system HicB family antitoxin [Bacillus sp. FJAT-45350]|uniref:type II toxin-antitoxin system HicB family antitoxin n=1 Tax=Bacillus sp. FJAT-45350 TaxID=2011014 RepID=UPI000BB9B8F7|nr:type II toxin-antitoxin system HicB family antitoxin [Bacillus sp. FJAT-45350]